MDILNKMNNLSKANKKRTEIDNYNEPQQKHRFGMVSKRFYVITNIATGSAVVYKHRSYSVRMKDFSSMHQKSKHINENTEMKRDEYSTAIQTLKR